jgi:hypothetical protein
MNAPRLAWGFAAGFVAVLVFHQTAVLILHLAGIAPSAPWRLTPVPPLGVPAVLSAAFWGGVWGVVYVVLASRAGWSAGSLAAGLVFGAVAPTLVAWFIVLPLKGLPAGGGFTWPGVLIGPIVNGAWGLGTALVLRALGVGRAGAHATP